MVEIIDKMPSCWKRKFIRIKRIIRVVFMLLICLLLGVTYWGPLFTYQHIIRWLPLPLIKNLARLTKIISQIATIHLLHLGIVGYAFHRLPKKNQYATETNSRKKNRKIAAIVISAIFIFCESAAAFATAGYLIQQRNSVRLNIREKLQSEVVILSPVLEPEKNANTNNTLLHYAVRRYSCCGVDPEPNCTRSHTPVASCYEGSPQCSRGCLDYIIQQDIFPFVNMLTIVAFLVGSFALCELVLELRKIGKTYIQG